VFTAVFLAVALSFPFVASAVGIGEIVSQSKLGEPLSIRVQLMGETTERIESSCLSLLPPDPDEEGPQDYLVSANLTVKTEMGRPFATINSHKPFNEAFIKIRLRVNCRGQGSATKTLIFLPDFDATLPSQIAIPIIAAETGNTFKASLPGEEQAPAGIALALSRNATLSEPPERTTQRTTTQRSPMPHSAATEKGLSVKSGKRQHLSSARATRKKRGRSEIFMLKISSELLDESRIGKISTQEREFNRQKLLDADDQMASFLAMQHQVKQLQDELGEIKLKLAQFNASSPMTTLPGANSNLGGSASSNTKEEKMGVFAGGLALAILALLLGLRYYNHRHSQRLGKQTWASMAAEPVAAPEHPAQKITHSKELSEVDAIIEKAELYSFVPTSSFAKSQKELSEIDAIIEEAELYSTYGHPGRATLMLQELIQQHPSKIEAWELLLFILSSQRKKTEFERVARDFMSLNKNDDSWKKIQAMGHSLEQNNPLYSDDDAAGTIAADPPQLASSKRRLIGNILVETGILSAQEMKNYLDNFDPKQDGRIGEYLVSRKAITNEQLNDVLRLQ